ncbi:DUF6158 family protein [Streptomyces paromomycinus]|uniref:Uncharacterized protein n=1 Tax=Streptomyces paromomycinus TaxID=92743 RepID=A0A401VX28_STREY|nr:DUF6158 family protein [Streptomyces paromomycinus]GCD41640.1 hypothetical protein GKJPGBOP_01296 [Streptomyces paromomycinus]
MPSHDTPTDSPRPTETPTAAPGTATPGVPPARLDEQQLLRELETIHRTRHDTLLHGSTDALATHNARMAELEGEYLRRHPRRWVASGRTRSGARARTG